MLKEYDDIVNPFCQLCGKYKGVGPCSDVECDGHNIPTAYTVSAVRQKTKSRTKYRFVKRCVICDEIGQIKCSRCQRVFCNDHSSQALSTEMKGLKHHIGTCHICESVICEYCWILEDKRIVCRHHPSEKE